MTWRRAELESRRGQALVELLVVLPVLLLLLVAASDFGKMFAISGKSEIASRYAAFRWFRGIGNPPCVGDDCNGVAGQIGARIEEVYFDDALDDGRFVSAGEGDGVEGDGEDVSFLELSDIAYNPIEQEGPIWTALVQYLTGDLGDWVAPIRGDRVAFEYDLPFLTYGREEPLGDSLEWGEQASELGTTLPAGVVAVEGNFVMLADDFSAVNPYLDGEVIWALAAAGLITALPNGLVLGGAAAVGAILWILNFGPT